MLKCCVLMNGKGFSGVLLIIINNLLIVSCIGYIF